MNAELKVIMDSEQRRRVRRSALLLGLIALAVYSSFILHAVLQAHR
jgi:hypothetical protein